MDHFNQECLIIKYKGENSAKKIFQDGQERPLGILLYNTDSENKLPIKQVVGKRKKYIDACEYSPPHHLKQPILGKTINFMQHPPKTIKTPLFHVVFFDQRCFRCVDWQVF